MQDEVSSACFDCRKMSVLWGAYSLLDLAEQKKSKADQQDIKERIKSLKESHFGDAALKEALPQAVIDGIEKALAKEADEAEPAPSAKAGRARAAAKSENGGKRRRKT
eukprot:12423239-Alexandrium_andersonii.AAC.1